MMAAVARATRLLTTALLAVLTVLLVEVLFESWVQELFGHRTIDAGGNLVGELPGWPKTIKNGLLCSWLRSARRRSRSSAAGGSSRHAPTSRCSCSCWS
jgi:hypothetical protein